MSIERDYTRSLNPIDCINTIKYEGGIHLRGFTSPEEQTKTEDEVVAQDLTMVDRCQEAIPEQFKGTDWEFLQSPSSVLLLGRRVCDFVRLGGVPNWEPTCVQARLTYPGQAGVEWHRDYKRDVRLIAIASFKNPARFGIRLRRGEIFWEVEPGDLVLLRAPLLLGKKDDRPVHKAAAPKKGSRLAIVYRQELDEAPELERDDE